MLQFETLEILIGLLVLIPLVALFIYVVYWKKKVKKRLGDEELLNKLTENYSPKNFNLKFVLQTLAILLCVVGAANLRSPQAGGSGKKTGIDVMVALDVSNSMLAQDVQPNRLERARQLINTLIDNLGDNRLGLVLFAGKSYLQMPLTPDLAAAKMYVSNASPSAVPTQGTVVGDALKTCNASLDTKEKKYKAVVLISDGETHDETTEEAVKLLQENGVIVYTVGIGSPGGSPIYEPGTTDYKKDAEGNTVISKLNEQELQVIAQQTQGAYFLFTNADEVATNIMFQLSKMDKKEIKGGFNRNYTSYFQIFIALAILLLLLEVIIPERKMKWI